MDWTQAQKEIDAGKSVSWNNITAYKSDGRLCATILESEEFGEHRASISATLVPNWECPEEGRLATTWEVC